MYSIKVEKSMRASPTEVFECIADHEGYRRFGADVSLVSEGREERNGLDAVRLVKAGPLKLVERITAFERPARMDYLIEKSSPLPMRHEGGSIRLQTSESGGCVAVWTSDFRVPIPLLGGVLERKLGREFERAFAGMLSSIDRLLCDDKKD